MSFGFRVYSANGSVWLDVTSRLWRLHAQGIVTIPARQDAFIPITDCMPDGTWAVIAALSRLAWVVEGGIYIENRLAVSEFSIKYIVLRL
jgi:hypothetical protein